MPETGYRAGMSSRQHRSRVDDKREVTREPDSPASDRFDPVAEFDDLLDEIDDVLESNAEEFVRNYVQKGGQ
jgi:ubiquitin-like protein Pup